MTFLRNSWQTEMIGKNRNWDYRYCWVRDASMIVDLYAIMGHIRSAKRFIEFILNRVLLKNENIAVMYGINGETNLREKILGHLEGYQGSKPVRIGNDAYSQQQNDIYGNLIETIYISLLTNPTGIFPLDEELWTVVRTLVNRAVAVWREPDCGIWERRGDKRHFVHSKLMNWVAMDRAAKIARLIQRDNYAQRHSAIAEEIKQDILTHGWDKSLGSFVIITAEKNWTHLICSCSITAFWIKMTLALSGL